MSEQHAQELRGQPRGIAYEIALKVRLFFKQGTALTESKISMPAITVTDDLDKEKILGRINYDLRGGIVICDDINKEQWLISCDQIWNAYQRMRVEAVIDE